MTRKTAHSEESSPVLRKLGARIKTLRHTCDLTQEELAHRAGLAVAYVARLESGKVNPTVATLDRLTRGLNVTLADLLRDATADDEGSRYKPILGEIQRLTSSMSVAEQSTLLRLVRVYGKNPGKQRARGRR